MCLNGTPYVEALKWKSIDYWIREEVVSSQRLGIERLKAISLESLVGGAQIPDDANARKALQSVHNYDILSNPEYIEKLLYVPCIIPMRSAFVISPHRNVNLRVYAADLVRSVLDLPYLPMSVAREFEFSVEFMARME